MGKKEERKLVKNPMARVRLTHDEDQKFNEYSNKIGVTRSKIQRKIIRELINKELDLVPEEIEAFRNAAKNVAAIGRNFNQLIRAINSGKVPDRLYHESYYEDIKTHLSLLDSTLRTYLDHTETRWTDLMDEEL